MKPQQTNYMARYDEKETRQSRINKLKDEYNEYLNNLTDNQIIQITNSIHFQLIEVKINGVKHN